MTCRLFICSYRNEDFVSLVERDDVLCALAVNVPWSAVSSASARSQQTTDGLNFYRKHGNRDLANT